MLEIFVIRPGATALDEAGRIKGSLDIQLSSKGMEQAENLSRVFQAIKLDCLYVAPCLSAQACAEKIAERNFCRQKTLECLRNLDHGLWQGKLISEVRRLQPSFYRQFQESPLTVAPPGGETVNSARQRVEATLTKLAIKHEGGSIAFLAPEPMASIIQCYFAGGQFGEIWKHEQDLGTFERIELRHAPIDGVMDVVVA
jgi:broad specificity phosphatase PhoE